MTKGETPMARLYLFVAACALFAIAYGFLGLEPSPFMGLLIAFAPSLSVAAWLAADTRRTGVAAVYDSGWLFYLSLPVTIGWYVFRTRGRAGWWLAIKLYSLAS